MKDRLKGWLAIIGAVMYGVVPFDLIPDFLIGLGWIDDATISGSLIVMAIRWFLSARRKDKRLAAPNMPPRQP